MSEKQDSTDYDARRSWASNFRKFRWLNVVIPVLTPVALVSIFLFGFWVLAVAAFLSAGFAWFDLGKTASTPSKRKGWRIFAVVLVIAGVYFVLLELFPNILLG